MRDTGPTIAGQHTLQELGSADLPPAEQARYPARRTLERTTRFASADDFLALLPESLDDSFDTSDLAAAAGIDRRLAQQMAYCLREMDVCRPVGRRGRAVLYARAPQQLNPSSTRLVRALS